MADTAPRNTSRRRRTVTRANCLPPRSRCSSARACCAPSMAAPRPMRGKGKELPSAVREGVRHPIQRSSGFDLRAQQAARGRGRGFGKTLPDTAQDREQHRSGPRRLGPGRRSAGQPPPRLRPPVLQQRDARRHVPHPGRPSGHLQSAEPRRSEGRWRPAVHEAVQGRRRGRRPTTSMSAATPRPSTSASADSARLATASRKCSTTRCGSSRSTRPRPPASSSSGSRRRRRAARTGTSSARRR